MFCGALINGGEEVGVYDSGGAGSEININLF